MTNIRIPRGLCAAIQEILVGGSHTTLDALFLSSGAPPLENANLPHAGKWKTWLFEIGINPKVDSLAVLGNIIEEYMDVPQDELDGFENWQNNRAEIEHQLDIWGYGYFRGGQILPNGRVPTSRQILKPTDNAVVKPSEIEELLQILIRGLPRAMHPLSHRRKNAQPLSFNTEYDVQDLLHALLRPWVNDIRAEEFTPSYAGTSTRMDFLLPAHSLVIELKFVRDRRHGRKIGDELIIDIAHYSQHPKCDHLWCVIYDLNNSLQNAAGLINDLEGDRAIADEIVSVKVLIV